MVGTLCVLETVLDQLLGFGIHKQVVLQLLVTTHCGRLGTPVPHQFPRAGNDYEVLRIPLTLCPGLRGPSGSTPIKERSLELPTLAI